MPNNPAKCDIYNHKKKKKKKIGRIKSQKQENEFGLF